MAENTSVKHSGIMMTLLETLISVYGFLYILVIIDVLFTYPSWNAEKIITFGLFFIFLAGYLKLWKNGLFAGIIFLLWYAGLAILGLFIVKAEGYDGFLLGLPLLALTVLIIVISLRNKKSDSETGLQESRQ
jgi:phosphate starvation-inducible membrane PsiE